MAGGSVSFARIFEGHSDTDWNTPHGQLMVPTKNREVLAHRNTHQLDAKLHLPRLVSGRGLFLHLLFSLLLTVDIAAGETFQFQQKYGLQSWNDG